MTDEPAAPAHQVGDERAADRLLAFSDAVIAIAITLIVLPLLDDAMNAPTTLDFFTHHVRELAAAGISFLVVATVWRAHHATFAAAKGYTRGILRLEFVWLGALVFLPVATVLDFIDDDDPRLAIGVYVATIFVATTAARVQSVLLFRAGLTDAPRRGPIALWFGSGMLVVVLLLVFLFPQGGAYWLLLLLVERLFVPLITRADHRLSERRG